MKIYDCFLFNNELDLLEIRMTELEDIVDYFVIAESNKRFNGELKPLHFKENKERYKKWQNKIIYIEVDSKKLNFLDRITIWFERKKIYTINKIARNFPLGKWRVEYDQKNSVAKGLKKANNEDIIFFSDADEIIPPKTVKEVINILKNNPKEILSIENKMFYYYLNGKCNQDSIGTSACTYKTLKEKFRGQTQRLRKNYGFSYILNPNKIKKKIIQGGWHFSYLGGLEKIKEKIPSISHSEYDTKKYMDEETIQKCLSSGKDIFERGIKIKYIKIPKDFPRAIRKNSEKYSHLIKNVKNT